MAIFDGLEDIFDEFLGVDETWEGQAPRYRHRATSIRLCEDNRPEIDGAALATALYNRIEHNWENRGDNVGLPSAENWRFEQRTDYNENNHNPETLLERTIASVVDDDNWANQVPVDSGLLGGRPHWIDLVFRAGTAFSLIELKYASNTPLSAAFQVLNYGLVYAFSRSHAQELEINLDRSPILRATEIHLRVLAPSEYYSAYRNNPAWLSRFEKAIHDGVRQFSQHTGLDCPLASFAFEAFPCGFWPMPPQTQADIDPKEVLWAVHKRKPVFCR